MSDKPEDKTKEKIAIELLKKDRDSLVYLSDSLSGELFPAQIELNRYQIAYKIFLKRDPQGAKMFGDIIANETE
jgi:predicted HTH domain antitoxin